MEIKQKLIVLLNYKAMNHNYIKYILYSLFICILFVGCGGSGEDDPIPPNPPKPPIPGETITISTNPTAISIPAIGGEISFTVTTNAKDWTASTSEVWLKVTKEGNKVKVQGEPNFVTSRSATITCSVVGDNVSAKVTASQKVTTSVESDRLSLIDLSESLGINWDINKEVDQWKGVEAKEGRIISIKLSDTGIKGAIPSSIGRLTELKHLDLSNNNLSGDIPSEINNLTHVEFLDLSNNNLSGDFPSIKALKKLILLDVSANKLTQAPEFDPSLSDIEYLAVNNNSLSGALPSSWSKYKKLVYLDVSNNSFTGAIPNDWSVLTRLRVFHLYKNSISGTIPNYVVKFKSLKSLALHYNNLTGNIPNELGNMDDLEDLWLVQNRLSGAIPNSILNNPNWNTWSNNLVKQQDGYGFSNAPKTKSGYLELSNNSNIYSLSEQYKDMYRK